MYTRNNLQATPGGAGMICKPSMNQFQGSGVVVLVEGLLELFMVNTAGRNQLECKVLVVPRETTQRPLLVGVYY
jgi:hypothetical protein